MRQGQFWLTDEQFAKIEPNLPRETRGKCRFDDRRVISGIVQVLISGGRYVDAPPDYGPRKRLYNRFVRWADKGVWVRRFETLAQAGGSALQVMIDSSTVKAHRSAAGEKGEKNQAIGRSRGGQTTTIHSLTDEFCHPIAFMLTGGNVADCAAGATLLEQLPECDVVKADKGYDANALRQQIQERGAKANIPPKANREWKNCSSPFLYRNRNAIERMFCRLKDFRRVATHYDRNTVNFLAAVSLAATVRYWL